MPAYDLTFFPNDDNTVTYYVASFVIDLSLGQIAHQLAYIDNATRPCDETTYGYVGDKAFGDIFYTYFNQGAQILYCAVGLDETLMHAEHPHYHVTIIFDNKRKFNGKEKTITEGWIKSVREDNWHYGQSLRLKISKWDGTMKPLGYATKEKHIVHPVGLSDSKFAAYQAAREYYGAKKKHELEEYEKEQKKKEHTKLLKDEVREYLVLNVKASLDELRDFMERPQMKDKYGYCECSEYDAVRVCLERYQIENNKHFQTFELNKYLFDYYRYVRGFTPVEMYFLRVNNNIR